MELREDEKMALQSIYGDAFTEKIPNKGKTKFYQLYHKIKTSFNLIIVHFIYAESCL